MSSDIRFKSEDKKVLDMNWEKERAPSLWNSAHTCVCEGLKVQPNDCWRESRKGWILYRPWLLPCDGLKATMWKYLRIFSKRAWLIFKAMLRLLKKPELQMLRTDSQRCTLVEMTKPRKALISWAVTGRQPSSEPKRSWNFLAYMLVWVTMFWMQLSGTKSWKKSKALAVAGIFWAGPGSVQDEKRCEKSWTDWQIGSLKWPYSKLNCHSFPLLQLWQPAFILIDLAWKKKDFLFWQGTRQKKKKSDFLSCHCQDYVGYRQTTLWLYRLRCPLIKIKILMK